MALILGIDQSISNTGLALYDTTAPMTAMRLHSFKAEGRDDVDRILNFRRQLSRLIKEWAPDFAAFEAPLSHVQPHVKKVRHLDGVREETTINARTALQLNQIAGACIATLDGRSVRFDVVRPATWRKRFLGYTTNKQREVAGHKSWKHAARAQCEAEGIPARNMDQAEAAGIAVWASECDAWKLLKARAA